MDSVLLNLKRDARNMWSRSVQTLIFLSGFGLSSQLRAQTVSDASEKNVSAFASGNPAAGIEDVAFSLAIVLVLIFALAWLVKRFAPGAGRVGAKHMQVLSTLPLGSKERLMLVDVAGTQMVLGVSGEGVACLHVFAEPVVNLADKNAPSDNSFGKILQGFTANREKS